MNLQNLGVQELSTKEITETEGGNDGAYWVGRFIGFSVALSIYTVGQALKIVMD